MKALDLESMNRFDTLTTTARALSLLSLPLSSSSAPRKLSRQEFTFIAGSFDLVTRALVQEARLPFARRRAEIAVTEDRRPSHVGV